MAEHKTQVNGFASLTELAETVGNLRYDALAEFLGALELKLMRDSEADHKRGRLKLSSKLHEARYKLGDARIQISRAFAICAPHMGLWHSVTIQNITHWHEHEIHDRIGKILGYDTWERSKSWGHRHDNNVTLTIDFRSEEDYLLCKQAIDEACAMTPN